MGDRPNPKVRVHLDEFSRPTDVTIDGERVENCAAVNFEHRIGEPTRVKIELIAMDFDTVRGDES